MNKLKNLIQNFKYMSFAELRLFWVIVATAILIISWFTLTTLQSKSTTNVDKIARVNQEMVKLTQTKAKKAEAPLLDDAKVKTAFKKGSPEQILTDRVKLALDYVDAKSLLDSYNKHKSEITGSIWSINAAGNSFTTPDWQAKANLGEYSQSVIDQTIAQNSDGSYTIVISLQPLGDNREDTQPMDYALHATIKDNVTNIDNLGNLETVK